MISIKVQHVKCLAPVLLILGLANMLTGCAKQFPTVDDAAVAAPVITNVLYNNTFIISGQHFDPQVSVVTVSGQAIPGFVFNAPGGQESLVLTSLVLNDQMDNPAPVVVTVRNVASNSYPFLFNPQIDHFVPDTAHMDSTTTIRGLLFGNRSVPSTLKAYYYDPNQRKIYMSPDPVILSWTTNTIQASIPDYGNYGIVLVAGRYLSMYLEVGVSTTIVSRGLYYSVR